LEQIEMPRSRPAQLGADIVSVTKGAARPLGEPARETAREETKIGITVRFPASMHERLRVLAFERRASKQALIENCVADWLTTQQ
jgi:hypothetical protein